MTAAAVADVIAGPVRAAPEASFRRRSTTLLTAAAAAHQQQQRAYLQGMLLVGIL